MTTYSPVPTDPEIAAKADAREFGLHIRQGGWRLGLLVARNVEPAGHGGARRGSSLDRDLNGKVNATRFAELAGTSNDRVLRYLKAWERAATAGVVPPAAAILPGTELGLNVETFPDWNNFYDASKTKEEPGAFLAEVVEGAEGEIADYESTGMSVGAPEGKDDHAHRTGDQYFQIDFQVLGGVKELWFALRKQVIADHPGIKTNDVFAIIVREAAAARGIDVDTL